LIVNAFRSARALWHEGEQGKGSTIDPKSAKLDQTADEAAECRQILTEAGRGRRLTPLMLIRQVTDLERCA
jgi:hypothetical protein